MKKIYNKLELGGIDTAIHKLTHSIVAANIFLRKSWRSFLFFMTHKEFCVKEIQNGSDVIMDSEFDVARNILDDHQRIRYMALLKNYKMCYRKYIDDISKLIKSKNIRRDDKYCTMISSYIKDIYESGNYDWTILYLLRYICMSTYLNIGFDSGIMYEAISTKIILSDKIIDNLDVIFKVDATLKYFIMSYIHTTMDIENTAPYKKIFMKILQLSDKEDILDFFDIDKCYENISNVPYLTDSGVYKSYDGYINEKKIMNPLIVADVYAKSINFWELSPDEKSVWVKYYLNSGILMNVQPLLFRYVRPDGTYSLSLMDLHKNLVSYLPADDNTPDNIAKIMKEFMDMNPWIVSVVYLDDNIMKKEVKYFTSEAIPLDIRKVVMTNSYIIKYMNDRSIPLTNDPNGYIIPLFIDREITCPTVRILYGPGDLQTKHDVPFNIGNVFFQSGKTKHNYYYTKFQYTYISLGNTVDVDIPYDSTTIGASRVYVIPYN